MQWIGLNERPPKVNKPKEMLKEVSTDELIEELIRRGYKLSVTLVREDD